MKKLIPLLLLLFAFNALGAMPADTIFEIRTGGSSTNGGCFSASTAAGGSGVDYSQQSSPQYTLTGGSSAGAGSVILHASASNDMLGNCLYVSSGTNATVDTYMITAVSVGVSVTTDKAVTTGVGASIAFKVGGAWEFGGSNEDAFFEKGVAGNIFYVATGTHATVGATISISAAGGTQKPIQLIGYNSSRGDNPTGSTRPVIAAGSQNTLWGPQWALKYFQFTTTSANGLNGGSANMQFHFVKVLNSSTTASRNAFTLSSADPFLIGCEGVSLRGNAISINNTENGGQIIGGWFHDSNNGITTANISDDNPTLNNVIISGNVTNAITITAAMTSSWLLNNVTLYGAENKLGTAINITTGTTDLRIINSNISGFVTGVTHADTQTSGVDNWNNYFNNTTDVTNWTKGANDVAVSPAFSDVTQITGTGATSATAVLTDSGKNFTTAGVVAGRDYLYVVSGTSVTVGYYDISAVGTTTVTSNLTIGASGTNIVYQITRGQNYGVSYVLSNLGYPGVFPGGYTTGFMDIGAAQRRPGLPKGR